MKIGLDLRRLTDTGIGRLSRNLTRAMLAQNTRHEFVAILRNPDDVNVLAVDSDHIRYVFNSAKKFSPQELTSAWNLAQREKLDVLHVPHQFHMPLSKHWQRW